MKNIILFSFLLIFISCDKDDGDSTGNEPDSFDNLFAFELDGKAYSFTDFEIKNDTVVRGPRVFLRKDDGDDRFTFNFLLTETGAFGMDWNDGSDFFFAEGDKNNTGFFTVDKSKSTVVKEIIDLDKKRIKATFSGIGEQALTDDTCTITNGVIQANF